MEKEIELLKIIEYKKKDNTIGFKLICYNYNINNISIFYIDQEKKDIISKYITENKTKDIKSFIKLNYSYKDNNYFLSI